MLYSMLHSTNNVKQLHISKGRKVLSLAEHRSWGLQDGNDAFIHNEFIPCICKLMEFANSRVLYKQANSVL